MVSVKLFYGSTSGNTYYVSRLIAAAMGDDLRSVTNIAGATPEDMAGADALIFGISTWDMGLPQKDWALFFPRLKQAGLQGKNVALFGLGDARGFSGLFVNGLRALYDEVTACGARVVGRWPASGYESEASNAVLDGHFVGLVIDQDNQSALTVDRVGRWVAQIRREFKGESTVDAGTNGLLGGWNTGPR